MGRAPGTGAVVTQRGTIPWCSDIGSAEEVGRGTGKRGWVGHNNALLGVDTINKNWGCKEVITIFIWALSCALVT